MNKKFTLVKDSMSRSGSIGYSKTLKALCSIALLLFIFAGCKKDDYEGEIVGVCPTVLSDPMDKAVDVVLEKVISITFNTDMDSTTINNQTFTIKQGTTVIPGKLATTASAKIYTFKPTVDLLPFTVYTGTVTTGAKDTFHTAMVEDYTFTFTTIPVIATSSAPIAGGITTGGGKFAQGSLTTVAATPNTGYTFVNWTENGNVVSTSSSYPFKMAGNRTLVANFAPLAAGQFAVILSSNPIAGGTNTGSGAYLGGSTVTVTATPNAGYRFVNWTEGVNIVSASPSYQFVLTANRTLIANYSVVPASQFTLTLSSNPPAGGTTNGSGSYNAATSVTANAVANTGYTFTNWTENGAIVSTSPAYTLVLNANRTLVANFTINTYTLIVNSVNGTVVRTPNQATYNYGAAVQLVATPNAGYTFVNWTGDAGGTTNTISVIMTADRNITANYIANANPPVGPAPINLGTAGDFATLTKAGISTTGITSVTGDIGVSPTAATSITGFGLIMDTNGQSSTTPIVTGKVYAADYAAPTPAKMTIAVSDMETAFTTGNALITPAPIVGLYDGDISGRTLAAGLYKWSTGVLISNAGVTLNGGPNDVWVFQIAQDLTVNNSAIITLTGGAQAKNIFWVVSGQATLGSNSNFSGIILSKTLISLNTGAKVTGRLLAQTAVTLNASTVVQP
jgi:uncharacterized repeat protein (TIGR02543 family)